jgi:hypothetical protein
LVAASVIRRVFNRFPDYIIERFRVFVPPYPSNVIIPFFFLTVPSRHEMPIKE